MSAVAQCACMNACAFGCGCVWVELHEPGEAYMKDKQDDAREARIHGCSDSFVCAYACLRVPVCVCVFTCLCVCVSVRLRGCVSFVCAYVFLYVPNICRYPIPEKFAEMINLMQSLVVVKVLCQLDILTDRYVTCRNIPSRNFPCLWSVCTHHF